MQQRIQKLLAQQGYGSRRKIDALLAEGRIKVNGNVAKPGDKANEHDIITIDNQKVLLQAKKSPIKLLIYNKPEGEVVTRDDPEGRPIVFANLPELDNGRWINIGRLDINSSGLLLFTNNGDVANKLMHPRYNLKRVYKVRVFGEVSEDIIKTLKQGVMLEDGKAKFDSIKQISARGINSWYEVSLSEGRNREVRRLWQAVGIEVNRLLRIAYGKYKLPRDLALGQWREIKLID